MAFRRRPEEKCLDVDATMQGSLSFCDPVNLRINGRFNGSLQTRGNLMIGRDADVSADITGDSIVIGGRIKGKIIAKECLRLLPTAIVEGDIYSAKLNVEEGARLEGKCSMLGEFLDLDELTRYLEVDTASVTEWVNGGIIPFFKEGEEWRFERKAIDSWIADGKISK